MNRKQRYYEKLVSDGRCPRCTRNPAADGKIYCRPCVEYRLQKRAEAKEAKRQLALRMAKLGKKSGKARRAKAKATAGKPVRAKATVG